LGILTPQVRHLIISTLTFSCLGSFLLKRKYKQKSPMIP